MNGASLIRYRNRLYQKYSKSRSVSIRRNRINFFTKYRWSLSLRLSVRFWLELESWSVLVAAESRLERASRFFRNKSLDFRWFLFWAKLLTEDCCFFTSLFFDLRG